MRLFRNVVILLIVLIALIAVYYYLPRQSEENDTTEDKQITVKSFNKDNLMQINIQNENGLITLVKSGTDWKMSKPDEYKLDMASIEGFINTFIDFKAVSIAEENAQDIDKYGLKTPESTVEVKTSDGLTTIFMLGNKSPIGEEYYFKTMDIGIVYLVDTYTAGDFLRSVSEFRDKAVFEFKKEDVVSLSLLKQGNETLKFVKADEWEISTAEGTKKGKQDEINTVVDKLANLKVKEFIIKDASAELSKYGLDKPSYEVTLSPKGKTIEKLLIGNKVDEYSTYVKKSSNDEVFTVDNLDINLIEKDLKEFIM